MTLDLCACLQALQDAIRLVLAAGNDLSLLVAQVAETERQLVGLHGAQCQMERYGAGFET